MLLHQYTYTTNDGYESTGGEYQVNYPRSPDPIKRSFRCRAHKHVLAVEEGPHRTCVGPTWSIPTSVHLYLVNRLLFGGLVTGESVGGWKISTLAINRPDFSSITLFLHSVRWLPGINTQNPPGDEKYYCGWNKQVIPINLSQRKWRFLAGTSDELVEKSLKIILKFDKHK